MPPVAESVPLLVMRSADPLAVERFELVRIA